MQLRSIIFASSEFLLAQVGVPDAADHNWRGIAQPVLDPVERQPEQVFRTGEGKELLWCFFGRKRPQSCPRATAQDNWNNRRASMLAAPLEPPGGAHSKLSVAESICALAGDQTSRLTIKIAHPDPLSKLNVPTRTRYLPRIGSLIYPIRAIR